MNPTKSSFFKKILVFLISAVLINKVQSIELLEKEFNQVRKTIENWRKLDLKGNNISKSTKLRLYKVFNNYEYLLLVK